MATSVILSTYNQPDWLEKSLWGFARQTYADFEIIVADDGSDDTTRDRIESVTEDTGLNVQHVWHEDRGFRKCTILNKAIEASRGEYLIFTDGDCIPRADFVATHLRHSKPNHFLSGGYYKLPMDISLALNRDDIDEQQAFSYSWLRQQGLRSGKKSSKLRVGPKFSKFMNAITTTKPTWNGHNASCNKTDIVAVNGFDERMVYGAEDRELGERLCNSGMRGRQIRYSAICLHLDHARGYVSKDGLAKNARIRAETKANSSVWTQYGILKNPITDGATQAKKAAS